MTTPPESPLESPYNVSRWALPVIGAVIMLFTFLNGVPWVSKSEFEIYNQGHDQRWETQGKFNESVDHRLDRALDAASALDSRLRELERRGVR